MEVKIALRQHLIGAYLSSNRVRHGSGSANSSLFPDEQSLRNRVIHTCIFGCSLCPVSQMELVGARGSMVRI